MWILVRMYLLYLVTVVALLAEGGLMQDEGAVGAAGPVVPPTETTFVTELAASRGNSQQSLNSSVAARASISTPGKPGGKDVGCNGLRSKRYISDGFCRTLKPISEVLCTGYCVPERHQAWYPEFMKVWGKTKSMEYRCVDGIVRHQRIKLMCDNGKMRSYKIKVVKSCACRKQVRSPPYGSRSLDQPDASIAAAAVPTRATAARHDRPSKHSKRRQTLSNA